MKKKLNLLVTALLLTNTLASCISMVDSKTDREAIVTCQTDADCGAGLECEIEHGASFCKPHGGDDGDNGDDDHGGDDD